MEEVTFEQVLNDIQSLPPESQVRLRDFLDKPELLSPTPAFAISGKTQNSNLVRVVEMRDFSADRLWLHDHHDEYAGQWVAVKFGQLIGAGKVAKDVFAAARNAGHPDALVVFVEPKSQQPTINIG
jgi:hypothetical protein